MNLSVSMKVYIGLIVVLAILAGVSVYFPAYSGLMPPAESLPAPIAVVAVVNAAIMLIVYGGLGLIGLRLAAKIGIPEIWDTGVSHKQRFLIPAIVGAACGVVIILADIVFSNLHSLGRLPHPTFPASIIASITAGIGEELLFRLFFISFWVWLVYGIFLKKRMFNQVFWIFTAISALAFGAGHLPAVMILYDLGSINEIPPLLMAEIFLLNGFISIPAAYYFRKYGFLAAVGIHLWADIVWHVVWGLAG